MRSLRRIATLAGVFTVFMIGLVSPAPTLASCAEPPPIAEALAKAEILFVGTVTATDNGGTWATAQVEEVWKGPDQPIIVLVKGGPGPGAATSIDRTFEVGVKYLFFAHVDGAALGDNACTSTTPWTDGLLGLRPADARAPIGDAPGEPTDFDPGGVIAPIGVAVLIAGLLLVVGLLARSRQPG